MFTQIFNSLCTQTFHADQNYLNYQEVCWNLLFCHDEESIPWLKVTKRHIAYTRGAQILGARSPWRLIYIYIYIYIYITVAPNICEPSICNLDSYRPSVSYSFEVAPKFLKTRHVRTTQHWGAFAKPFLPWKAVSVTYCYVYVRAWLLACVCVRALALVGTRARGCVHVGALL